MMAALMLLLALVALLVSSFCSGAETGFLSVRRGRVLHLARSGGVRAKIVLTAISNMGRTMTALLVGNNLANVVYSSSAAAFTATVFGDSSWKAGCASFVVALILLLLGEFLPKLFASTRPLRSVLLLAPGWRLFARLFVPLGARLQVVIERFLPKREVKAKVTLETVMKILEDRKDGVRLSAFERALIGRILTLRAHGEFIVPDSLLSALEPTASPARGGSVL